jgi:hypothetical protein
VDDAQPLGPQLESLDAGSSSNITAGRRTARVFGYLGIAVVWLAIFLVVIFLWAALPAALSSSGPLGSAPGITELADPGELVPFLIAMILIAVPFGFVLFYMTIATFSLLMLSLTFLRRSLDPGYGAEPLSSTRWTSEAIGPMRIGGAVLALIPINKGPIARWRKIFGKAAISLIPVRQSPVSRFWTQAMMLALVPSWRMIFSTFWFGLAYLFTVAWILWPVTGALVGACSAVSVAVTAFALWRILRAIQRERRSWLESRKPDGPVGTLRA